MLNLNKKEKLLWEAPWDMYYPMEGKENDIELFALTNQNFRIKYFKKINLFKKELVDIIIPLDDILFSNGEPCITLTDGSDEVELLINTVNCTYKFFIYDARVKHCSKQLSKAIEIVKKNVISKTDTTATFFGNNDNSTISTSIPASILGSSVSYCIQNVEQAEIRHFLFSLGDSPFMLTEKNCNKIKVNFPIPKEHCIIWADCEFDLRCSGIVCTDKGLFIKSNVNALDEKNKKKQADNTAKSNLYYFKWAYFNPAMFTENNDNNLVHKVDKKCQQRFINACSELNNSITNIQIEIAEVETDDGNFYNAMSAGLVQGTIAGLRTRYDFINQYGSNPTRHGWFAEEANNLFDRGRLINAEVVGGDNAKNGADRQIHTLFGKDVFIQTKYCATANRSVNAAFGKTDGLYRYFDQYGRPMKLEVPKEQYLEAIDLFKEKIRQGKVIDPTGRVITDEKQAYNIVKEGSIRYEQAVNLGKAGTIDSIKFDIKTGIVSCSFAFGISCLTTMYFSYQKNKDMGKALQDGIKVGAKVFGLAMLNHVFISQLYRTSAFQHLNGTSVLTNSLISSGVSLIVYSIPEIIKLLRNNISFAQFMKNTAVIGASIFTGAIGGAGGAAIGSAIGSKFGSLGKIIGTAIGGVVGGTVGAIAGSKGAKGVADIFHEDDHQIFTRLLSATISSLVMEYMLNEEEIELFMKSLNSIDSDDMKKLMQAYRKSNSQEEIIREFLLPHIQRVCKKRKKFKEPTIDDISQKSLVLA